MRKIGLHLSISGGLTQALKKASNLGVNAVQIFLKNSNRWESKPYTDQEIDDFLKIKSQYKDILIFAHTGYLINIAGQGENLKKSILLLQDELKRASLLGIDYLVLHPGSHKGEGTKRGLKKIIAGLDTVFAEDKFQTKILLETTAGQGTSIGHKFEHFHEIISKANFKTRLGVCLDTCHIFTAGYDFRSKVDLDKMIKEFDSYVGLDKLKLIHLNDSKKDLGSKVDRHEHLGQGFIGLEGFRLLLNDKRLKKIPLVLETPKSEDDQADLMNLKVVKELIQA